MNYSVKPVKVQLFEADTAKKRPVIHPDGRYSWIRITASTLRELVDLILSDSNKLECFSLLASKFTGKEARFYDKGDVRNAFMSANHDAFTQLFRGDLDIDYDPDIVTPAQCYEKIIEPALGPVECFVYPSMSNYMGVDGKGSRFHFLALFEEYEELGSDLRARVKAVLPQLDDSTFKNASHFVDTKENMAHGAWFGEPGRRVVLPDVDVSRATTTKPINDIKTVNDPSEADRFAPFSVGTLTFDSLAAVYAYMCENGLEVLDFASDGKDHNGWRMDAAGSWVCFHENNPGAMRGTVSTLDGDDATDAGDDADDADDADADNDKYRIHTEWSGGESLFDRWVKLRRSRGDLTFEEALDSDEVGSWVCDWSTGSGKTYTTQKFLKETGKKALVVLPDIKSCSEWQEAIGDKAEVFKSREITDSEGNVIRYEHELVDRLFDGRYRFLEYDVILISHSKFQQLMAPIKGFEHSHKLRQVLLDHVDIVIVDEKVDTMRRILVSADDLLRVLLYDTRLSDEARDLFHTLWQTVVGMDLEEPIVWPDTEVELEIMKLVTGSGTNLRDQKNPSPVTQLTVMALMAADTEPPKNKHADNPAPAELYRACKMIMEQQHYDDGHTINFALRGTRGGRAMWIEEPMRRIYDVSVIELDATARFWRNRLGFEFVNDKPERRYDNVDVVVLSKDQNAFRKLKHVWQEAGDHLIDGPTLVVGRKSEADTYSKFGSEHVTWWAADRGTNAYIDSRNVVILQYELLPGWLEIVRGPDDLKADAITKLIQVINRGVCRIGERMRVIVPYLPEWKRRIIAEEMPGITFIDIKERPLVYRRLDAVELLDVKELTWKNFGQEHQDLWKDAGVFDLWKHRLLKSGYEFDLDHTRIKCASAAKKDGKRITWKSVGSHHPRLWSSRKVFNHWKQRKWNRL